MNKILTLLALICVAIIFCTGCKTEETPKPTEHTKAIYYWRTILEVDSIERVFLQKNCVGRAYVRFFDIVADQSPNAIDSVVPNATVQFKDTLPVKDIIPTIFITQDAIAKMHSDEDAWAEKIVKRIFNMCSYNDLEQPKEVQLDCDWTHNTQNVFFSLCKAVKQELRKRNPKAKLSATIRLHQLPEAVPPVDYGVLMLYNTGSFMNYDEHNSIISVENIRPYMVYLADYSLHLDYAYPIFSWNLVYNNERHFKGLINSGPALPDNILNNISGNNYEVSKDTIINNVYLHKGDFVRKEDAPFKTLMEVKQLIEENCVNEDYSIILYQLDKKNIINYSDYEFKQIYK